MSLIRADYQNHYLESVHLNGRFLKVGSCYNKAVFFNIDKRWRSDRDMLVNDTTIYLPHSEIVISDSELNQCLNLNGVLLGPFPINKLISEERLTNFERLLGYGSLYKLTKGYTIELAAPDTLIYYLYVGKIAIPFGAYQGTNAAEYWSTLASMNSLISATYIPSIHQFVLVNDAIATNRYGIKKVRNDFLLSRLQLDESQVFQVYDNQPLVKVETGAQYASVPTESMLRNKFNNEANVNFLDQYVERNNAIKFHSDFDPTGQLMQQSMSPRHTPVEQTFKQYLFRMNPLLADPGVNMQLSSDGTMFKANIASPYSLAISSIDFQQVPNSDNIMLILQLDSIPFIFGVCRHNIIPYLQGEWTSLYWPSIRYFGNANGTNSTSFNDNIYLFKNEEGNTTENEIPF